ncbi:hypothetical protein BDZ97DRAFT_1909427 [Flammula alnicola]|nr:hypothetical protein BDZ97DRAFT_1909427 [Flammula alnicola]
MPAYCPRCGKRFLDDTRLLNHLNQPYSSCLTHYEELLCFHRLKFPEPEVSQPTIPQPTIPQPSPGIEAAEAFEGGYYEDAMDAEVDNSMDIDTLESTALDLDANISPFTKENYPTPSQAFGLGSTFMDRFDQDQHSGERKSQLYYPFASKSEWELASFLLRSNLSMASLDKLLKLKLIQTLGLSFHSAKDLRNRAEMLPSGPAWKSMAVTTVYLTKNKLNLFYRNPVECLESLMGNPLLQDSIQFTPFRLFESAVKTMRVYTEWLSGDAAWSMQEKLPKGATLLGTVLSSDKTNISAMTGNRVAHPLLISLANINMEPRNKSTNHLFLLLALLPIAQFIHRNKKIRGVLNSRLFHQSLDIILAPLKKVAEIGVMMADPLGWPRTASTTIAQLQVAESLADPWNLEAYIEEATKFCLNGVHRPFWRDYPLAEPSAFLTSEPLHHWHKQFWDHDAKWCINALGGPEIDFRFSVLHPHTGFRHFKEGISQLKQVTGREHRDVQRYIVSVISQAVPPKFLIAIRALIDFRYLAQSKVITEDTCDKIQNALQEFHDNKQAIIDAGARRGKKSAIQNWYIPKLEFLQSVVSNIRLNGVAIQWSADTTEHAHIEVAKDPAKASNNQNIEPQICRYLDRSDKLRNFDLATAIHEAQLDFRGTYPSADIDPDAFPEDTNGSNIDTTSHLLANIDSVSPLVDYFKIASKLKLGHIPNAPCPHRTQWCSSHSTFHLTRDPSYKRMSVDQVAALFQLPDLHPALGDYLLRIKPEDHGSSSAVVVGGRRTSTSTCLLPFSQLEVWNRVRIQTKTYHAPHEILPAQTVNAYPPSKQWPLGRYDSVIANIDSTKEWPKSGLNGHLVIDLRLIFRIVPSSDSGLAPIPDQFLAYVQRFDVVPQVDPSSSSSRTSKGSFPEATSSLYILKRRKRSNGIIMGDILPLCHIRTMVDVVPHLGEAANRSLTAQNSTTYSSEYLLNKYFDKELFWALS